VRGVNLGGWLLLEPWITPVFFEEVNIGDLLDKIVDEWTYAEYLDEDVYKERMIGHWSSFVVEEDFAKLSEAGISHVRVPIGYWYWDVLEDEPFPTPNSDPTDPESPLFYLLQGLQWIEKYGLVASLDLHSGPGSQNGYDNSGKRGEIHWVDETYPENRANIDRNLDILDKISATMVEWIDQGLISLETLYGVGILNEPHICGPWYDEPKYGPACMDDFYPKAYDVVRKHFDERVKVVLDVAAKPFTSWAGYMAEHYEDIDVDAHHYQCFGPSNEWAESDGAWEKHLAEACRYKDDIAQSTLKTWGGEFSLAITDCQEYLQGGFVTPYDPVQSSDETCSYYNSDFSTYPQDYKDFLSNFFLAQIDSYEAGENGIGWMMWTAKTENNCAPEWDFIFLWENGILPADLCNREHYCQ